MQSGLRLPSYSLWKFQTGPKSSHQSTPLKNAAISAIFGLKLSRYLKFIVPEFHDDIRKFEEVYYYGGHSQQDILYHENGKCRWMPLEGPDQDQKTGKSQISG